MKPVERFARKLETLIAVTETMAMDLRRFHAELELEVERDATLRKISNAIFSEGNLDRGAKKILEYIRANGAASRTELSRRFSRSYTSKELYSPGGILDQLVKDGLIESRLLENANSRPALVFTVLTKHLERRVALDAPKVDLSQIVIPDLKDIQPAQAFDE
jgi:hypothetical protein